MSSKERLYLFDTTLRWPSDRSRAAGEDGQDRQTVARKRSPHVQ